MSEFQPGDLVERVPNKGTPEVFACGCSAPPVGSVWTVTGVVPFPTFDTCGLYLSGWSIPYHPGKHTDSLDAVLFRKAVQDPEAFIRKVMEPVHVPAEMDYETISAFLSERGR